MLMLLFYVGDERYVLESKLVVEVIPLVGLKKLHNAPDYVAGLFKYRSNIVPAIDLCQLMQGTACRSVLSSRIVLVNYIRGDRTPQLLGLMAERVTQTLTKTEADLVDPGITLNAAPYLGKIITDEQGMIQCIRVEHLLPGSQEAYLLPESEE